MLGVSGTVGVPMAQDLHSLYRFSRTPHWSRDAPDSFVKRAESTIGKRVHLWRVICRFNREPNVSVVSFVPDDDMSIVVVKRVRSGSDR